jgi:hypothetical protein
MQFAALQDVALCAGFRTPIPLAHVSFEGGERKWRGLAAMSLNDLGRVKTKSNLVVALSGGGIFALFCSERDHKPQNSGCGYTA